MSGEHWSDNQYQHICGDCGHKFLYRKGHYAESVVICPRCPDAQSAHYPGSPSCISRGCKDKRHAGDQAHEKLTDWQYGVLGSTTFTDSAGISLDNTTLTGLNLQD